MGLIRFALALALVISFHVSIGASDQTQLEMNQEACGNYKKSDLEMNRIYQKILRDYSGDKNFVQKMKVAQRAWVTFRDAHLDSIYPDPSPGAYGSVNPMCR